MNLRERKYFIKIYIHVEVIRNNLFTGPLQMHLNVLITLTSLIVFMQCFDFFIGYVFYTLMNTRLRLHILLFVYDFVRIQAWKINEIRQFKNNILACEHCKWFCDINIAFYLWSFSGLINCRRVLYRIHLK